MAEWIISLPTWAQVGGTFVAAAVVWLVFGNEE